MKSVFKLKGFVYGKSSCQGPLFKALRLAAMVRMWALPVFSGRSCWQHDLVPRNLLEFFLLGNISNGSVPAPRYSNVLGWPAQLLLSSWLL